ncbi:hypothetical protein [Pontibacter anaerobius]|uniref:Uncharacterized protein n=1 Tax=Pontibacter anaerobius TaxID=2993940 RepID=A0ABT3RJZ9_9BACT|nr:hypothetical protein [Pontibacter anaerobius]MCX2741520.1 hypothetical protein [Pontibacter anaerobius]
MLLSTLEFTTILDTKYLTIRHCPEEKLLWNEWRGVIPSQQLRQAIIYDCNFILENDVELLLADYLNLSAPVVEDQVWVARHSAPLLRKSRLRKVANLLAQNIFQQLAVENFYEKEAVLPRNCVRREFVSNNDALVWLLSSYSG